MTPPALPNVNRQIGPTFEAHLFGSHLATICLRIHLLVSSPHDFWLQPSALRPPTSNCSFIFAPPSLYSVEMARGNQRDKAREKNLKAQAGQKKSNSKTGSEMQREREALALKMREKQAAGGPPSAVRRVSLHLY